MGGRPRTLFIYITYLADGPFCVDGCFQCEARRRWDLPNKGYSHIWKNMTANQDPSRLRELPHK